MRLLHAKNQTFHEFIENKAPPYAALSHTWGAEEITYKEVLEGVSIDKSKSGWKKIQNCCRQAVQDGLEFVWIDTCCIDKSSSAELQEAINSMFRWYEMALECYVYMCDFECSSLGGESRTALVHFGLPAACWFTRGWTLQELLAPCSVRFFDSTWLEFGDKISLKSSISEATGIQEEILQASVVSARQALDSASIAQRMSWAAGRTTTREEDLAYCMLGIFDVNMPLLYGEGPKAFQRLQEEILKVSDDQSILAWGFNCETPSLWGVSAALAQSPYDFVACREMISWGAAKSGDFFAMTQRGLQLHLPVCPSLGNGDVLYCIINCSIRPRRSTGDTRVLAIPLLRPLPNIDGIKSKPDQYYWLSSRMPIWVDKKELLATERMTIYIPRFHKHGDQTRPRLHLALDFALLPEGYYVAGTWPIERSRSTLVDMSFNGADVVLIHFAKEKGAGFVLLMKSRRRNLGGELHAQDTMTPDVTKLSASSPNTLSISQLKKLIQDIFASETGLRPVDISETLNLDYFVDSLMSLSICARLKEETGFHFSSDLLFGSKTIRDVQNKLRFMTRPDFRHYASSRDDAKSAESCQPQIALSKPVFAVMEVAADASLVEYTTSKKCFEMAQNMDDNSQTVFTVAEGRVLSVGLVSQGPRNTLRLSLSEMICS